MTTLSYANGDLTFWQGSPYWHGSTANMIETTDYFQLGGGNKRTVEDTGNESGGNTGGTITVVTDVYAYRSKIKFTLTQKSKITLNLVFADNYYAYNFMCGISQTNVEVIGNICEAGYGFNEEYLAPYIIEEINPLAESGVGSVSSVTLPFETEFEAGTYYIYLMCATYGAAQNLAYAKGSVADTTIITEPAGSVVYIDNGTTLDAYQVYIDNGTSWDLCSVYIDNGTSWDQY